MQTKIWIVSAALVAMWVSWGSKAVAFQQDFPSSEPGYSVSFIVNDAPGSRSACVVKVSRGLPTLALAFNIFSDNDITITAFWTNKIPNIQIGKNATIRINDNFLLGKIIDVINAPPYHTIAVRLTDSNPALSAMSGITDIIFKQSRIDVSADGKALPGVTIPPAPSLNAAILACMQFKDAR